ncbi:cellulose synthase operon protein YhjQ [Roseomonas sp. KE2513]|uniref:cellulose synthase operon protein YhjQ/BcsQ n=1 Tax=Roseomonas sp. KE2513 TaxID=2479202 RepID=UPI0018DFFF75|nr:cellulose synthase operon protein YhjQ/BcsQ [Roseomonas sp. KE2513]MBI0538873.1 cellulose synthase operon protein YhjQ [Roseomonas sp. KE2513]
MPLICFASPKGGVGKTTLTANLADALHRLGHRVLAVDLDSQNALRLHFGVSLSDRSGFVVGLAQGESAWRTQLRQTPSGVLLLPHGAMDLRGALDLAVALDREPDLLGNPMREMLADPDLVVVADLPPGPSQALALLAPMATMVIGVLQAEAISAALVPEIESGRFLGTGTMAALLAGRLRVVLNGVDLASRLSRASAEAVARHLGYRMLGAMSREETVAESLACQRLLLDHAPESRAASDLKEIARLIAAALPAPLPAPYTAAPEPATLAPGEATAMPAVAPAAQLPAVEVGR